MTPQESIDQQIELLLRARAVFPFMPPEAVGKAEFATGLVYAAAGHRATITFSPRLSNEERLARNAVGHWINQNFIVRLWAIMDSSGTTKPIRHKVDGAEEVDLVRRLRHQISHSSGRLDANKPEQLKLQEALARWAEADAESLASDEFPVSIDSVLLPLAGACKRYLDNALIVTRKKRCRST